MDWKILVAADDSYGMSRDGDLPWKASKEGRADMQYFAAVTANCAVIMGRKTWDTLAGPLRGRINVVLSRSAVDDNHRVEYHDDFATVVVLVNSFDEALEQIWRCCQCGFGSIAGIYVIGGAALIDSVLDRDDCGDIIISRINGDYDCDVKFPIDKLDSFRTHQHRVYNGPLILDVYKKLSMQF